VPLERLALPARFRSLRAAIMLAARNMPRDDFRLHRTSPLIETAWDRQNQVRKRPFVCRGSPEIATAKDIRQRG
jgi:hypothetical protein